ncbi:hypothetical protein D3C71_1800520 [compost metagenome]
MPRQGLACRRIGYLAHCRQPVMAVHGPLAALAPVRARREACDKDGAVQAGKRIQRSEDKGGLPCPVSATQALAL